MQQDSCIRDCWGSHVFQSQQALYEGASLVRPPLIRKQVHFEFCAACCNFLCHASVLLVMFASWSGLIRPPFQTPLGRSQDITGCVWQRCVQASLPDISLHFQYEAPKRTIAYRWKLLWLIHNMPEVSKVAHLFWNALRASTLTFVRWTLSFWCFPVWQFTPLTESKACPFFVGSPHAATGLVWAGTRYGPWS